MDSFHYESTDSDIIVGPDTQLKEDLADAMRDCATVPNNRESGELKIDIYGINLFLLFYCGSVDIFYILLFIKLMHNHIILTYIYNINMEAK